jgi:hypothetical protein
MALVLWFVFRTYSDTLINTHYICVLMSKVCRRKISFGVVPVLRNGMQHGLELTQYQASVEGAPSTNSWTFRR